MANIFDGLGQALQFVNIDKPIYWSTKKNIPYSRNGSILFTTWNKEVAVDLDAPPRNIHAIGEMNKAKALELL